MNNNICVVCGKKFKSKRKARFCSKKCNAKEYYSRLEIKKRAKEYYSRPKIRKRHNEHMKEYYSKPEIRKRHNEHMKEYYLRPEIKKRKKEYSKEYNQKRVIPYHAIEDFFMYASRTKFNSVEELKITALNYTKATCSIEGNCEIQKRIFEDERFELYCSLIERRLSGAKKDG